MVLRDRIHASLDLFQVSISLQMGSRFELELTDSTFRDDFNPPFIALFAVLYFLRSFHWIAGDRIDYASVHLPASR